MSHPSDKDPRRSFPRSVPRWALGVATLVVVALLTIVVTSVSKIVYDEGEELEPVPALDAPRLGEPEQDEEPSDEPANPF